MLDDAKRKNNRGAWDDFDLDRHCGEDDDDKASQKSNDTARLSFSMNEEAAAENEVGSKVTSPFRANRAQMPVVNNIKTKTISSVFQ